MLRCLICCNTGHKAQFCPQIFASSPVKDEKVNHPTHYSQVPGVECIEVTRWFNFSLGNAIKYIWRAGYKGDKAEDLKKAIWYLQNEIERLEYKDVP